MDIERVLESLVEFQASGKALVKKLNEEDKKVMRDIYEEIV